MVKRKIHVAVLGATGSVGQRFVQLLDNHPWFHVAALTGSDKSVGKYYVEACRWNLPEPMPEWARGMVVQPTSPENLEVALAFSALPAEQAKTVEPAFAMAGIGVCSNASAFRRETDVPILLPEVNADHASVIEVQRANRGWRGFIVTNPNCTSTGMTVALKPMIDYFGISKVFVVSLQALSGAGFGAEGVPSMDIVDNVIPYIKGEEEKLEWEPRKMLGKYHKEGFDLADFRVSAHTNRVQVSDGHLVCLSIELSKKAEPQEIVEVIKNYSLLPEIADLPSAPKPVLLVKEEPDRPQPRLDRMTGRGMSTVVGRIRKDPLFDVRMIVLSHNTIRGAAGGAIFNAELLVKYGYL